MKNMLNPRWLLLLNTIPTLILYLLFLDEYQVIKSQLSPENMTNWMEFGSVLILLGISVLSYALYSMYKKEMIMPYFGIVALAVYVPFLVALYRDWHFLIPNSIPNWMLADEIDMYAGTFIMPTLIYSLLIMVIHLTKTNQKAGYDFVCALAVPLIWYAFIQTVLPLWQKTNIAFEEHVTIAFFIAGVLAFLFFLMRGTYVIMMKRKDKFANDLRVLWAILFALILPIGGLALNESLDNIFGNFSHSLFYGLTVANFLILLIPPTDQKVQGLITYLLRCFSFSYTFYFFIVFLPFTPLSIFLITILGTGFLTLTPIALFITHLTVLSKDFNGLRQYFSSYGLIFLGILGFSIMPIIISGNFYWDKYNLEEALDYVYNPDYSKKYDIDRSSLNKTLEQVKKHQKRSSRNLLGKNIQIPYISSYYSSLVLNNLTLSTNKINYIENIFYGVEVEQENEETIEVTEALPENNTIQETEEPQWSNRPIKGVDITDICVKSEFDATQNVWLSWVELEITNFTGNSFREYETVLDLPIGCWISDYYLYVGDKKEMGLLTEKRAAMWVYSQIRNINRDPGLLHYLNGNRVAFRVFPFAEDETRKTGFQLIHKEPFVFDFDGHQLYLGDEKKSEKMKAKASQKLDKKSDKNVIYVSKKEKQRLPKVQRKPYYHFIVDASENLKEHQAESIRRINKLLKNNLIDSKNAKISFVDSYVSTHDFDENWKNIYASQKFEGGFYLDRAIKTILVDAYQKNTDSFPILVVVTDDMSQAIWSRDFSDMDFIYPESESLYRLNYEANLEAYSLKYRLKQTQKLNLNPTVLAYPNAQNPIAYLADNQEASIVLQQDIFELKEAEIKAKNWDSGLQIHGKWLSQKIHPETSDKAWLQLVKYSFISQIMNPYTSYIVVENEAQKEVLKRKQTQIMNSHHALDVGEDVVSMSEPNLLIIIGLLGIFMLMKYHPKWVKA